jgi:hypothetical protein
MRTLTLHLKREFFEAIKSGDKTEEYRLYNEYWKKRLVGRDYDRVVFCLGYPRRDDSARRIARPYTGYTVKTIVHAHFGNEPVTVFAINTASRQQCFRVTGRGPA